MEIKCRRCGQIKNLDLFYKGKCYNGVQYYNSICIDCKKIEYREKHPEHRLSRILNNNELKERRKRQARERTLKRRINSPEAKYKSYIYSKKQINELTDVYVTNLLSASLYRKTHTCIKKQYIPKELIELKRVEIIIKRALKTENYEKCNRT